MFAYRISCRPSVEVGILWEGREERGAHKDGSPCLVQGFTVRGGMDSGAGPQDHAA